MKSSTVLEVDGKLSFGNNADMVDLLSKSEFIKFRHSHRLGANTVERVLENASNATG